MEIAHALSAKRCLRYRQMLIEKSRAILRGLGSRVDAITRTDRISEDDWATLAHDEFVSLKLHGMDEAQLRLVEEALARLKNGDFGVCLRCEAAIAPKRLDAIPWARYCVRCQEKIRDSSEPEPGLFRARPWHGFDSGNSGN